MVRNHISMTAELDKYKADVYQMLIALGCSETTTASLMKSNQQNILGWFGENSSKAPIVTAQMAARLILRDPREIEARSKLLGH
ncbi:hypothetical protein ABVC46_01690 [Lactobacillus crispatus]|uniref:Uncharacterized protein n=1 Tax=Lactobacillus crispatus TaxID=47770 RepID=A0AAW8WJV9_9LACO|nr:hypothetical protein [Lactobacillus crispatus]STX18408.1 Uncharacterised protein [Lactobacillus acidophilus]MCZ3784576.1 hypothetical protein [Lactobacillus crispatus]MCZ3792200.1 hypothetical protein [Lactobacillus crispatus]MDT9609335.1 hypothetical protein [Lactobacillus crispatus]MDT9617010.1 hypothetical protein [Lactobacillus crispatus]